MPEEQRKPRFVSGEIVTSSYVIIPEEESLEKKKEEEDLESLPKRQALRTCK